MDIELELYIYRDVSLGYNEVSAGGGRGWKCLCKEMSGPCLLNQPDKTLNLAQLRQESVSRSTYLFIPHLH